MVGTRHSRQGTGIIWTTVALMVMVGMASLAVDFGRAKLVRTELQNAADAAALAAAANISSPVADVQANAVAVARANRADGTPVLLSLANSDDTYNDVQFIAWDGTNYTVLNGVQRDSANAIRVITRRTAARGNPVKFYFASILGIDHTDITAAAIAQTNQAAYAVVGLDYIKMGGNSTDSYSAAKGTPIASKFGDVASNGDITLTGSSYINGNARPGIGKSVSSPSRVSGSSTPLSTVLAFPDEPDSAPTNFETVNANADFNTLPGVSSGPADSPDIYFTTNKTYALPGGVYYVDNFTIAASATVTFDSPTYLFCHGTFDMSGSAVTSGDLPTNLTLVMVPHNGTMPGSVTVGSGTAFRGTVWAPHSPVIMSGTGDIYGSLLGKSIDMTGTSRIIYDLSLKTTGEGAVLVH